MQITKPTLLSLATVLAVTIPSASAGEVKFELDTDSNGDKPNNPLFACSKHPPSLNQYRLFPVANVL